MKKKVTLSIEEKIYNDFQKFCEKNAIMLSKKIEIFMQNTLKNKTLNLFILLFLLPILLITPTTADTIFSDDFEDGDLAGWTLTTVENHWTNEATDPQEGSRHAQAQPRNTNEPASVMERIISTSDYENINLSYYRKLIGLDGADEFQVEYNTGSGWIIIEQTGAGSVDDLSYEHKNFLMPASADNNTNYQIKFECTAGAVSEFCRLDNITISGDIIASPDTTPPSITINSPLDNEFLNINTVKFNITLNEDGDTAWYTLNSWTTNITLSSTDNRNYNQTNTSIADGSYTIQYYANDTSNNINNTVSATFTIDTILPTITLSHPQNTTYTTTSLSINFTATDTNLQSCWYTDDNGITNTTLLNCANTSYSALQGNTTITIYANDSANNQNSTSVNFTVDSTLLFLISFLFVHKSFPIYTPSPSSVA